MVGTQKLPQVGKALGRKLYVFAGVKDGVDAVIRSQKRESGSLQGIT